MRFKHYEKDGSCDMEFTWRERFRIFFKGKIFFNAISFKHFVNHFSKMIFEWQVRFGKKHRDVGTYEDTKIETK